MAILEKPVHKETCAQLRLLLRLCAVQLESENNGISKVLAVIAGGYFRQDEGLISQTELSLTVNHKL